LRGIKVLLAAPAGELCRENEADAAQQPETYYGIAQLDPRMTPNDSLLALLGDEITVLEAKLHF
jgi:hypothetical protein